jgi:hypothetical protein
MWRNVDTEWDDNIKQGCLWSRLTGINAEYLAVIESDHLWPMDSDVTVEWGITGLSVVGSGDLKGRWVSQYPIPHGQHYDPCTLRRTCKSAFLNPEEEIQGLIDLPQGWWAKCSQDCSTPPIRGKQTSSSKKAHKSTANKDSPPNTYPNPELFLKAPAFTWAGSHQFLGSTALL